MKETSAPSPQSEALNLDVTETTARAVMSCYALDLTVTEAPVRAVMSCYALDIPEKD
jgi:hypothetical protein